MNLDAIMPRKLRHHEFELESIGAVVVLTIELQPWMVDNRPKYETAVIWESTSPIDDGYQIMHVGFDKFVALDVHKYWCDTTKLAELIHISVTSKSN